MSAAFASSGAVCASIAFATSLVIARGLGVEGFGRWALCTAWAAVLTMLFDLGFGVLLTRDAARDDPATGRLVGAALVARLGLLLPVAVAFIVFAPRLSAEPETIAGLRLAPVIAAAGIAYGCLAPVFRAWPRSLVVILAVESSGALLQFAGAWWLLRTGADLAALLLMAAIVQIAQLAAAAALWRVEARPRVAIVWPARGTLPGVVRRAVPFAAAGLVANAQLRVAPLMLGYLSGPAALAAYGVASRIGNLARMLPHAAFGGALPVFSHELRHGTSDGVRARFERVLLVFAGLAAVLLAAGAGPIVLVTYGDGFQGAVVPLMWTAAGLVPALMNSSRKVYLYAAGGERVAVKWSAAALVIQLLACAALIPSFGAAGAAAALTAGEALVWWPLHRRVETLELRGRPVGVMGESPLAG
jgi:O-antigen/teichoic acid export membrane protein